MAVNLSRWRHLILIGTLLLLLLQLCPLYAQGEILAVDGVTGTINTGDACPAPRSAAIYRTIQSALDCAQTGDAIQITAGSYPETLSVTKSLTLQGADAATVIVDGGSAGSVLTVDAAIDLTLTGLTLTHGSATDGAGIWTSASTLTITDCIVSSNIASARGAGLFTQAGTVRLNNTQVTGNNASDGGGIFTEGGTVTLHASTVSDNLASGAGGGIFTQAGSLSGDATIYNNTAGLDADIHTVVGAVTLQASPEGTLKVTVTLQGRPTPPDPSWSVPLSVTLALTDESTPALETVVTTDQSGAFVLTGLAPGSYSLHVKHSHSLSNLLTVEVHPGVNAIDFGVLREGDTDDNDLVNLTDFSLLATTFGKQNGEGGYDGRADFNGDDLVSLLDFSLLASNFGQSGPGYTGAAGSEPPSAPYAPLPTPQPTLNIPLPPPELPTDEIGSSPEPPSVLPEIDTTAEPATSVSDVNQ